MVCASENEADFRAILCRPLEMEGNDVTGQVTGHMRQIYVLFLKSECHLEKRSARLTNERKCYRTCIIDKIILMNKENVERF